MARIVFMDIPQPIRLQAVEEGEGDLSPNTTYYYKVVAVDAGTFNLSYWGRQSKVSEEVSVTIGGKGGGVLLSFEIPKGAATSYRIFRTKISGDYDLTKGALLNSPSDGANNDKGTVRWYDTGFDHSKDNYIPLKDVHGIIYISDGDFSLAELWLESESRRWNVIDKIDETTYVIRALLSLTNIVWSEKNKTIIFYAPIEAIDHHNQIRFGEFSKSSKNGCTLIWKTNWLANNKLANVSAYDTRFLLETPSEDYKFDYGSITLFESGIVQDCVVNQFREFKGDKNTDYIFKNIHYSDADCAFGNGEDTYENLTVCRGNSVFRTIEGKNIRAVGIDASELIYGIVMFDSRDNYIDLVNCLTPKVAQAITDSTGTIIDDKITYDLTVYDEKGQTVESAAVKIYDNSEELIIQTITDENGAIPTQEIIRVQYSFLNVDLISDNKMPLKVIVEKSGDQSIDYFYNYTSSKAAKEQISLVLIPIPAPKYIYIDQNIKGEVNTIEIIGKVESLTEIKGEIL